MTRGEPPGGNGLGGPSWDEQLFKHVGEAYDAVFAREVACTEEQAAFAARVLSLRPGHRLLDICCGTGRHSLALARREVLPTGVDREASLLAVARQRAKSAGLNVQWVQADVRRLPHLGHFHAALCMFASWGYAADPTHNARVLGEVARCLMPGGHFLLDLPSLAWLEDHPRGTDMSVAGGTAVRERRRFDPQTRVLHAHWRLVRPGAPPWEGDAHYRVYAVEEVEAMAAPFGLALEAAYGGFDGSPLAATRPRSLLVLRRQLPPLAPPPGR